jgi:glycosyltransferase involved in cell wall biosynthesis
MPEPRIRVCHIITRLDIGGAAENTLRTVCGLDPNRYEVLLIYGHTASPLTPWIEAAREKGVRIVLLPSLIREVHPLHDCRCFFQLVSLLRRFSPHLVHTHQSKAGVLGRWAARTADAPVIVHTPHGHIFYGYYGAAKTAFYRFVEKTSAAITGRMITLTDRETEEHLECGIGKPEKFTTIHSGVDTRRFEAASEYRQPARQQFSLSPDTFCVGAAGRLVDIKNFGLLIDALALLEQDEPGCYSGIILGEGPLRTQLQNHIERTGLTQRIHLPGWSESTEQAFGAFDAFALTSRNEGQGRVLVEAMAAGVPVLGTAVGGVPELLGDNEYGLLVPPDDAPALAGAIRKIRMDEGLRNRLIGKGRGRAAEYTEEKMLQRMEKLYEELLRERVSDRSQRS